MGKTNWKLRLAAILLVSSLIAYAASYLIFNDPRDEMFWFIESLAFLPIEVLIVAFIIDSLLTRQEKRQRLEKMSMVTDAFFSEVGSDLLRIFLSFDRNAATIRGRLNVAQEWSEQDYSAAKESLSSYGFDISCQQGDLDRLRKFVVEKRGFLLGLLGNSNLLEHESFTEMLRATFHMIEELIGRGDLNALSQTDYEHIAKDINRVYAALVGQWLDYMVHLKKDYPYLYSLAARTNPFNLNASAEIR
jgi:hypothetical protein